MLSEERAFTAQIEQYYKEVEKSLPPSMREDLAAVNQQFGSLSEADVNEDFIYLFCAMPNISKAIHLAMGRTEIATKAAARSNDPRMLREYPFTIQHNKGEGIIVGPMGAQTIDSGYLAEETRVLNEDMEIRGTVLVDIHTHPTLWENQVALMPSVINLDESDGDLTGDMWSFVRQRRVRQARLAQGSDPFYSDKILHGIFQAFPEQNLVSGLFIMESEKLRQMDDRDYATMLLDNKTGILSARSSSAVVDVLRGMDYRAQLLNWPQQSFYRFSLFELEHHQQLRNGFAHP